MYTLNLSQYAFLKTPNSILCRIQPIANFPAENQSLLQILISAYNGCSLQLPAKNSLNFIFINTHRPKLEFSPAISKAWMFVMGKYQECVIYALEQFSITLNHQWCETYQFKFWQCTIRPFDSFSEVHSPPAPLELFEN